MLQIGSKRFVPLLKTVLWPLCLAPFALLALAAFNLFGLELGANPVEEILHTLGNWGLKFLLITLSITPLRRLTRQNWLISLRRLMGLFAFFYILMHFMVYFFLDQGMDLRAVGEDILKRPYITLGMTGLILLVPLAVTSTRGMMRRLGARWQKLHKLVYVIAVLGVWHFYWQVKQDILEPVVYALILFSLLAYRAWYSRQKAARMAAVRSSVSH